MLAQKREKLARGIAGDAIDMPWSQFTKEELELAKGRISPAGVKRLETAFNAVALHCAPPTVGAIDYKMLERFIALRGKDCEPATTKGDFSVLGVSGDRSDIFICDPGSLGSSTSCTYSAFWDGSANGFGGEKLDGFFIIP